MSKRTLLSRSTVGVCLVVAAAFVSVTCGGDGGPEAVTGPEAAVSQVGGGEAGQVSALVNDKDKDRVDVCHYDANTGTYSDLTVPGNALQPHLDHGDFLKWDDNYDCTLGPCPCFSASGIDEAAQSCDSFAYGCDEGPGALIMSVLCVGGSSSAFPAFISTPSSSLLYCQGSPLSEGHQLTAPQYQACLDELANSVFVTVSPSVCEEQPQP